MEAGDESTLSADPDTSRAASGLGEVELPPNFDGDEADSADLVDYVSRIAIRAAVHTGPLPPAAEVEKYERLLPGAADRLFALLERKQEADLDLERMRTAAEVEIARAEADIARAAGREAAAASRRGQWMSAALLRSSLRSHWWPF